MKIVEKKIYPKYFYDVKCRTKNFELREDMDNISVGDLLVLKEWDGINYTGNCINRIVRYVLRNTPEYGLKEGYCIIGF